MTMLTDVARCSPCCARHSRAGCVRPSTAASRVPGRGSHDREHPRRRSRPARPRAAASSRPTSIGRRRTTASARASSRAMAPTFRRRRVTCARVRRSCSRPRPWRRRRSFRTSIGTRVCRSTTAGWSRPCPIRASCTQMGMRVGIPNAGQVNALETLNIRGERSVTCKGAFDAHPSTGPLPPGAPPGCEAFRQQPDALERAAELDAQYGANPDLAALPMYCVTVAFKDPYDTKDMRTTSNNDVDFAMDVPPFDSTHRRAAAREGRDHLREVDRRTSSTAVPAIPAGRRRRRRTSWPADRRSAAGAARPAIRTTPNACRADRAADPASRSPPTWSRSASANRRARPARGPRRGTASRSS